MTPLPSYTWVLETEHFNSKRRLVSCVFGVFFFFWLPKSHETAKTISCFNFFNKSFLFEIVLDAL